MWPADLAEEVSCDRTILQLRAWLLALVDCIIEACTVLLTPQTRPTDVFKKDDDLNVCEASFLEAGLLIPQHNRHFPAAKTPTAGQDPQLRRSLNIESGSGYGVSTSHFARDASPRHLHSAHSYHPFHADRAGRHDVQHAADVSASASLVAASRYDQHHWQEQQQQQPRAARQDEHPSTQPALKLQSLPAGAKPHLHGKDSSRPLPLHPSVAEEASIRSSWRMPTHSSAAASHQHSHTDDGLEQDMDQSTTKVSPPSDRLNTGSEALAGTTVFVWPAHEWPGQANVNVIKFADLQMGQLIGEGAFGKVYYGVWKDQEVAVKVLMADSAEHNTQMAKEFEAEIRVMSALPPHPNVLKLVGACLATPAVALVTQFCRKGSLYGILHSPEVQLSWSQIAHLCLGAARGMQHLHSLNCLHRDLKSGNLLVDASWTVKVADFGLARALESVAPLTGGLGTFQWMAPEVLARQHYSQKADVYAFGIVVWEACARQVPYAGLNGIQAALAVMERGLRPTIPPHTPRPLTHLIRACWAAIPEQRPSFNDITAELEILCHSLRGP